MNTTPVDSSPQNSTQTTINTVSTWLDDFPQSPLDSEEKIVLFFKKTFEEFPGLNDPIRVTFDSLESAIVIPLKNIDNNQKINILVRIAIFINALGEIGASESDWDRTFKFLEKKLCLKWEPEIINDWSTVAFSVIGALANQNIKIPIPFQKICEIYMESLFTPKLLEVQEDVDKLRKELACFQHRFLFSLVDHISDPIKAADLLESYITRDFVKDVSWTSEDGNKFANLLQKSDRRQSSSLIESLFIKFPKTLPSELVEWLADGLFTEISVENFREMPSKEFCNFITFLLLEKSGVSNQKIWDKYYSQIEPLFVIGSKKMLQENEEVVVPHWEQLEEEEWQMKMSEAIQLFLTFSRNNDSADVVKNCGLIYVCNIFGSYSRKLSIKTVYNLLNQLRSLIPSDKKIYEQAKLSALKAFFNIERNLKSVTVQLESNLYLDSAKKKLPRFSASEQDVVEFQQNFTNRFSLISKVKNGGNAVSIIATKLPRQKVKKVFQIVTIRYKKDEDIIRERYLQTFAEMFQIDIVWLDLVFDYLSSYFAKKSAYTECRRSCNKQINAFFDLTAFSGQRYTAINNTTKVILLNSALIMKNLNEIRFILESFHFDKEKLPCPSTLERNLIAFLCGQNRSLSDLIVIFRMLRESFTFSEKHEPVIFGSFMNIFFYPSNYFYSDLCSIFEIYSEMELGLIKKISNISVKEWFNSIIFKKFCIHDFLEHIVKSKLTVGDLEEYAEHYTSKLHVLIDLSLKRLDLLNLSSKDFLLFSMMEAITNEMNALKIRFNKPIVEKQNLKPTSDKPWCSFRIFSKSNPEKFPFNKVKFGLITLAQEIDKQIEEDSSFKSSIKDLMQQISEITIDPSNEKELKLEVAKPK